MARGERNTEQTDPAEPQMAADTQEEGQVQTPPAEVQSPPAEPQMASKRGAKVKNQARAGQLVYAETGVPISFDEDGIAIVTDADLAYLLTIPGYEKA
jgi:hypothetical protein